jgi:uncharacterized protein
MQKKKANKLTSVAGAPAPDPLPVGGRPLRGLLSAAGVLFTALALLGILLPVLPTTPFLLLAAWCFARSSPRLYRWLHENRLFGEYLRRYRSRVGLPSPVKATTISLLGLALGASAVWAWARQPWLSAVLVLIGTAVTAHIAGIKTREHRENI